MLMNNKTDILAISIFQERIKKGLLGPGTDCIVYDDDIREEIITDYPLVRYFTGIIFPKRERLPSQNAEDDALLEAETADEEQYFEEQISVQTSQKEENLDDSEISINEFSKNYVEDLKISSNNFFPTNIGLTFCLDKMIKEIEVEFSFGVYYPPKQQEIKVAIDRKIYDSFVDENSPFPFKDILEFKDGYMFLKRELKGHKGGRGKERSGEYKVLDKFKKSEEIKKYPLLKENLHLFELLIGRVWKRKEINKRIILRIPKKNEISTGIIYEEKVGKNEVLRATYQIKTYELEDNLYIKILLVNDSTKHSAKKFSNKNENLNKKCLFQSKIRVSSPHLKPFNRYEELHPFDIEAKTLNFIYRDIYNYGVGHNCSVMWDSGSKHPQWIETSFLPEYDVRDLTNDINFNDSSAKNIDDFLDIYNMTIFGEHKNKIIENLKIFANLYYDWIKDQENKSKNSFIEKSIIECLYENYRRLKDNIELLNDDKIYQAFIFTNTAMYIQLIISKDPDFCGREKMLSEIHQKINYKSLDFFKNYDFNRLPFGRPRYRPFQLAFFLINIEGIVKENSTSRNEIVDLLWFPTGGGKTEAYLAVAAFTIIWRRLFNKVGYSGTTVIMRYTLRLLTAQQFERAARLICALEFLRINFPDILRDEPITIGLWIGMASTPNSIKEASEAIEEISEECNKGDSGHPESKNIFQISSCPWCGTNLINKNKFKNWDSGFHIRGKGKNKKLTISCLNENCQFDKEIPVKVVDEVIYKDPPTLLFSTVDKFAMLAWEENGHKFFNSLSSEGLPPDLIIQDELHLINGPLGSIAGIFESIVELLCTKGNRKPKIIASTATTRNTKEQINDLYGERRVNIFPPIGLTYKDNFFARIKESESKRRYMGFMPTGKTLLDTQIQLLAHLLVARLEVYEQLKKINKFNMIDNYWTIVSYYNSLKDVGKIYNKVADEITNFTSTLQLRVFGFKTEYTFNYYGLSTRVVELTSRIESSKIKQILKELEEQTFKEENISKLENGSTYIHNVIDLALATNMISVGLDIKRLNIMLINGQPKSVAEYIQSSSRIGRQRKGLVITLLDANRARDKSHFENFVPFHQAFYKNVEPLSVTPFTENTIEKMIASLIVTYVRHKKGLFKNNDAQKFEPEMIEELKDFIRIRFRNHENEYIFFERVADKLALDWKNKIDKYGIETYKDETYRRKTGLLKRPAIVAEDEDELWKVMQSMREIDTSSYILIQI